VTRAFCVARREYLEGVRSKSFIVATVLGPVIMAAFMIGPSALMSRQRGKPLRLAVVDGSGVLKEDVESALVAREQRFLVEPAPAGTLEQAQAALKQKVMAGDLDGFLYFPGDALTQSTAEYYGKNVSNMMDLGLMEDVVKDTFVARRLRNEGIDPTRIDTLTRRPDLKRVRVTASGSREDRGGTFFLSIILLSMLYTSLAMWGAAIMNGVIEEKTNRVVEVMVSAMPTTQLFFGKLAGVGAAGLTQFVVWAGFMALISVVAGSMATAQGFQMPEVSLLVLVFFPVVLGSPDSTLSVTLSLIPFFTPLLMFLRMTAVTPPFWQLAASVVLMVVAIAGLNWVAARIYRVGILMYGKRPTFPEIVRWVGHR